VRTRRSSLTVMAVAALLGLLLVVQFRAQSAGTGLDNLSAQELTVLVANLNTRNDELRTEVATLDQESQTLSSGQANGATTLGQLQLDLARVRGWAGLTAVTGPGIQITVSGPIAGGAIEDLLNELRNAGAEAMAIESVRVVSGTVVFGPPGAVLLGGRTLDDPFEISAIGNSETLVGSLTRAGGIVAQLGATYPEAQLTVTPVDNLLIPATNLPLVPTHGHPKL